VPRLQALAPAPVKMNRVGQQPLALLCLLSLLLSLTAAPLHFSPPRRAGEGWRADHFVGFDDAMGTRLAVGLLWEGCRKGQAAECVYNLSRSSTGGANWTAPAAVPGSGCVRPRLLVPGTTLLLAGGRRNYAAEGQRGDILLWESRTLGKSWTRHSVTAAHNARVRNATFSYTAAVNGSLRGPAAETTAYTSLIRIAETKALLVYDAYLQAAGAITFSMEVTTGSSDSSSSTFGVSSPRFHWSLAHNASDFAGGPATTVTSVLDGARAIKTDDGGSGGQGLFISGDTAAEVTALPHYEKAVQRALSAPHNQSSSSEFISSFVISPITRDSGGVISTGRALEKLVPMMQQAKADIFIGTNWLSNMIQKVPDTYCGQLVFNQSFSAADVADSAKVASNFVRKFPNLNFSWYITPESFIEYFAMGCQSKVWKTHVPALTLARAMGRHLDAWTRALRDVHPAAHFLWSPSCPESVLRHGFRAGNGSGVTAAAYRAKLIAGLKALLDEAPLLDMLVLQDSVGKASNVSHDGRIKYGVTADDAIWHAKAAQEAVDAAAGPARAKVQLNMEMFLRAGRRVPSALIVDLPADPAENCKRVAKYHSAGLTLGPSWEIGYWERQQELGKNWTSTCRQPPCKNSSTAPPCCDVPVLQWY
jgi:hypothetical protein